MNGLGKVETAVTLVLLWPGLETPPQRSGWLYRTAVLFFQMIGNESRGADEGSTGKVRPRQEWPGLAGRNTEGSLGYSNACGAPPCT